LLEAFEHDLSEIVITPSGSGVFEVTVDGRLLFSKKATGRHAEIEEVLEAVQEHRAQH
jgi:selenoprotein W-related protein